MYRAPYTGVEAFGECNTLGIRNYICDGIYSALYELGIYIITYMKYGIRPRKCRPAL